MVVQGNLMPRYRNVEYYSPSTLAFRDTSNSDSHGPTYTCVSNRSLPRGSAEPNSGLAKPGDLTNRRHSVPEASDVSYEAMMSFIRVHA